MSQKENPFEHELNDAFISEIWDVMEGTENGEGIYLSPHISIEGQIRIIIDGELTPDECIAMAKVAEKYKALVEEGKTKP